MREKIGRFSGSERLDAKKLGLEEPDSDTEFTKDMWLGGDLQDNPDFKQEIKKRVENWKKVVAITADPSKLDIHLVGESHIDVAWLWRYEQTRRKAIVTFRKAVLHAKMFPGQYNFALSEPLLLEWVKEDDPELFKDIQDCVKNGGIELVGGSYVEPDCMMPSGESFVRMRLYGMRFDRDNFGVLPEVEWFLDSFGYNWGIPQILVKSGAKYFWTSKITWNLQTVFPFVNFWWQGPDGSKIITCNFQMGPGPLNSYMMFEIGRHPLKPDGRKVWDYSFDYEEIGDHVEEDEVCPIIGNFAGKGDGGHGPTHQEVAEFQEYVRLGFMHWSKVHTFYNEIEKWSDRFPVWNDELYLENHRGTFTVIAFIKRFNRYFENALTANETLSLVTYLINNDFDYPMDEIESLWKTTLKSQFHDVLPGSSIPEVYDDSMDDWDEGNEILEEIRDRVSKAITSGQKGAGNTQYLYMFNPASWRRKARVFFPASILKLDDKGKPPFAKLVILDKDEGEKLALIAQPIAAEEPSTFDSLPAGWWVVTDLNGLSMTPAKLVLLNDEEASEMMPESAISIDETSIDNGLVSVKLDPSTGAMIEIKAENINNGGNLLKGKDSNLTVGYLDDSKSWPAWNLTPKYWEHPLDLPNDKEVVIKLSEKGHVFSTIQVTRTLGESPVTQEITLFNDCPEIFLKWKTDWKQPKVMLKIGYYTATDADMVTADIAYSAIKRSTRPKVRCDQARYEKICHKYFDLSTPDKSWGAALINEGKYAFDADGGLMRLTLLRSPSYHGPAGEAWVNQERLERFEKHGTKPPVYSALEPMICRYALLPHEGGALLNKDGTANPIVKQRADQFNMPVLTIAVDGIELKKTDTLKTGETVVEINPGNVTIGAIKQSEWEKNGNVIMRVVETSGIATEAKVTFHPALASKIKNIIATDLLERKIEAKLDWNRDESVLTFPIKKFEIFTLELEL
ncbi:MAG: alpha-mannosidase [Candidatus Hodarchaeota archaeon]